MNNSEKVKIFKKTGVLLILILAVCFSLLFACRKKIPPVETEVTISGFEVKAEVTAYQGETVYIEYPRVTDSTGKTLDCIVVVTDAFGESVATQAGGFKAAQASDYSIKYSVTASDERTYTKTTLVKVVVGEDFTLTANYEKIYEKGDVILITPVCSATNAAMKYEVNFELSGEAVSVSNASFTPQKSGLYRVKITAQSAGKSVEYSYQVIVRERMQEGEIECYDSTWEYIEAVNGSRDYTVVTSSECGLNDRNGFASTFAKVSTEQDFLNLFINIRGEREYYSSLALKGYTKAVMWVYLEAEREHKTELNYYHSSAVANTLKPNSWTAIEINLEAYSQNAVSFTTLFDFYKNGMSFVKIDNSGTDRESGITVYIADMYVVKNVIAEKNDEFDYNLFVGDTVNFDNICKISGYNDLKFNYILSHSGTDYYLSEEGAAFKFSSSGEYTLKCFPKRRDLNGFLEVKLGVLDAFVTTGNNLVLKRENTLQIDFSQFGISFSNGNITPTVNEYTLKHKGNTLSHNGSYFVADSDGYYEVTARATYLRNGIIYYTYKTVYADIYSENNGGKVAYTGAITQNNINEYTVTRENTQVSNNSTAVLMNLGGREGNYIKVNNSSLPSSVSLQVKPLHSKAYYETLLNQNSGYSLKYDVFAVDNTGFSSKVRLMNFALDAFDYYKTDVWHTFEIPLRVLIENWDNLVFKEAELLMFQEELNVKDVSLYVGNFSLSYMASAASVSLKAGASVQLKTNNNLSELFSAEVENREGKIKSVSVEQNGQFIYLNGNIFRPEFSGNYNAIFHVEDSGAEKYVNAVINVGGTALENRIEYIRLCSGESFDFNTLLSGSEYSGYSFSYEVYQKIKGNKIEYNYSISGGILEGIELEDGEYEVLIFAVDTSGSEPFNKIICYTVSVDYDRSSEPVYARGANENNSFLRNLDSDCGYPSSETGLHGREGNYIAIDTYGNADWSLQLLPLHSKTYYEQLYAESEYYTLTYDIYFEDNTADPSDAMITSFINKNNGDYFFYEPNTWHTFELSLGIIIEYWEELTRLSPDLNEQTKYAESTLLTYRKEYANSDIKIYIGNFALTYQTSEVSVENIGGMLTAGDENDLLEFYAATINGDAGEIVKIEIEINGEFIEIENNIFTPALSGDYNARFYIKKGGANGVAERVVSVEG